MIENNIVYSRSGSGSAVSPAVSGCTQSNNRVNVDPMLVDPSSAPFGLRLRAGSPAIDAATTLPAVRTDFDGLLRPQGQGPDLGAFERAASDG